MKNWRTILVTTVLVLLVAILGGMVLRNFGSQAMRVTKGRIRQYEVIRQEQELIRDILKLRYETAQIQAKFKPAPLAQPQFVPKVPPVIKE